MSSPISSVIPSLDGPVLAALAGTTRPLNLTRVHRLCGRGSLTGVRRVLVRLVATGIVTELPGGYVLNREHLASPAIEQLAQLWGSGIDRIRATVEQWPSAPALVGIFGSAARRDGDEDSDIDVLVVSDAPDAPEYGSDLADTVQLWTGNPTHVVTVTTDDLQRMRSTGARILNEWDRDLITVIGSPEVLRGATV